MKKKPPESVCVHPGQVLRTRFLEPTGRTVYALAKELNMTRSRLNDIVRGRRAITAETAIRLSVALRTTPEYWMNLQVAHDLHEAKRTLRQHAKGSAA